MVFIGLGALVNLAHRSCYSDITFNLSMIIRARQIYYTCRIEVDMYGWYGNSDLRGNNGELSSHYPPSPVDYVTHSGYLKQYESILQYFVLSNLTFNVTIITSSPNSPTIGPTHIITTEPLPDCIDPRLLYAIIAIETLLFLVLLLALIGCYRNNKNLK